MFPLLLASEIIKYVDMNVVMTVIRTVIRTIIFKQILILTYAFYNTTRKKRIYVVQ